MFVFKSLMCVFRSLLYVFRSLLYVFRSLFSLSYVFSHEKVYFCVSVSLFPVIFGLFWMYLGLFPLGLVNTFILYMYKSLLNVFRSLFAVALFRDTHSTHIWEEMKRL